MAVLNRFFIDTNQFDAGQQTSSVGIDSIPMNMLISSGNIRNFYEQIKGIAIFEPQAKTLQSLVAQVDSALKNPTTGAYSYPQLGSAAYNSLIGIFQTFNNITAQIISKVNEASKYVDNAGFVLLKSDERVKDLEKKIALASSAAEEQRLRSELSSYNFARSLGDVGAEAFISQVTLNTYAPEILNPPVAAPIVVDTRIVPGTSLAPTATTVAPAAVGSVPTLITPSGNTLAVQSVGSTTERNVVNSDMSSANTSNNVSNTSNNVSNTSTTVTTVTEERALPQTVAVAPQLKLEADAQAINSGIVPPMMSNNPAMMANAPLSTPLVGSAATDPTAPLVDEQPKSWFRTIWEKHKLWVIVSGVVLLFLIIGTILYLVDKDSDREEKRVARLKQQKAKLEGQVEGE